MTDTNRHGERLARWAESGQTGEAPRRAATVVLLRDGSDGLETLMLRKNSKIAFGGMWVFPGGRVDPGDREGLDAEDRAFLSDCGVDPTRRPWT